MHQWPQRGLSRRREGHRGPRPHHRPDAVHRTRHARATSPNRSGGADRPGRHTTFDGVNRTPWWGEQIRLATGWERTGVNTLGLVTVIAIVVGHVAGGVPAHDRSAEDVGGPRAPIAQLPMSVVMIGLTVTGLAPLLSV